MQERSSGAIAVAIGFVLVGVVVGYETSQIADTPLYAKVGPKVFPSFVAGGLILLGLALLWDAWSGRWKAEDDDESRPIDWSALGWLGFGLLFNVALIGTVGFILASTVLFASVARAFGSTKPARDIAIAFVFAAIVYIGFAKLLGINMGTGLIERFL
ncbi:MAG: tripartite tricarboxylate transporter TctB family protein [Alphaproteobacteria bacterium]|nr:tripartite tricarboxylate transporter TctB family protein [Alphaproteobacteria bacterium]